MKKWLSLPPPLHVLMPLLVLACSLVYVFIKGFVIVEWQLNRTVEDQIRGANFYVTRLAKKLGITREIRERLIADDIALLQTFPSLRWAGACDPQGRFVYCTRETWVGRQLTEVAPQQAAALAAKVTTTRTTEVFINGRNSVLAGKPVPETPDAPLEYVVLAERDAGEVVAKRRREAHADALMSAGGLAVFCLMLWFVLYVFVRRRMRDFYRKTGLDNRGHASPVPLQGGDEFAEISRVLSKAEHLLRDIAENLQEVIWIVTPELKPVYLSPTFEKIYMLRREDIYFNANAMPEHILKEYRPLVRNAFLAVLSGASSLQLEYRIRRGDGQIRWIEVRGFPVRDAAGVLQRIVGISRDITEQKNLQEQLVNVSEQERHSLGHDLHDDACQRLAAIKLKSETLAILLRQGQSPHSTLASQLTAQIGGTSTLLRNIARGLAPVEVEGDGLMHALQKLVLMQENIHEVPCFFDAEHTVIVTNGIVATHLYRIAQEFITNAARHAKPERIDIKLEGSPDQVRITVTNDGLPFQKALASHTGMGLKIIRYRASAIGATIDIHPRSNGITGTVAECTVPYDICLAGPPQDGPSPSVDDTPDI